MSNGNTNETLHSDDQARTAAWEADRQLEAQPLPGHGQSHYSGEAERQAALAAAEPANIAKAAGELGMTSDEWLAKRTELGRSPNARDI